MRVALRCDGASRVGAGHVVRCLALAEEAIARGHEVELFGSIEGDLLHGLLSQVAGVTLRGPAPLDTNELAAALAGFDVVHVDSYEIGEIKDAFSKHSPPRVLSSMHDGRFGLRTSDVTVDPTPGSEHETLAGAGRWTLRGARYVPLRRSVLQRGSQAEGAREPGRTLRALVVLGGTDPTGSAPHLVRALLATGVTLDVTVVASMATRASLDRLASESGGRVIVIDPSSDLATRIVQSDLVVTAAGSTVWEVCALKRPMVVMVAADNQIRGFEELVAAGAAIGVGGAEDVRDTARTAELLSRVLRDPALRAQLVGAAHDLVDGLGAWRIVASWEELFAGATTGPAPVGLRTRTVTEDDAHTLLAWRNDPTTRELSRSSDAITYADHVGWLRGTIEREDRLLLIASDDDGDVGTVRWDREGRGEWEVSITVAPERRGQKLAGPLLAAGEGALSRHRGAEASRLLAVVHEDNVRSRRLFTSSGYLPDLPADVSGFARWTKLARTERLTRCPT